VDGERLTVRVLRNSPVLALETLTSDPPETSGNVTADALRRYLPRQASPAPLLSNLSWIANGKDDGSAGTLPASVTQAANKLWQALPDSAALADPATLRNAVARSGMFLEAALANADRRAMQALTNTDLKALMLNLTRVLREAGARPGAAASASATDSPMPFSRGARTSLPSAPASLAVLDSADQQMNELARQTDGAVARMTTLQANASSSQDTPIPTMLVELPMRQGERASVLRLKIERDRSRGQTASSGDSWSIEAAMDLGVVGALHARVTLQGHRIGVQLRAESAGVVDTLTARAPELESMLRESGLEVDRVVCLHGMPAADNGARPARLLDVRA
jgi:hypothetical protein